MTFLREIDAGGGGDGGWELIDAAYQSSGTTLSVTIPASTLTIDGEYLFVEALYSSAASGQSPRLKWDAVQFSTNLAINSGQRQLIRGWILRTGASAQDTHADTLNFTGASPSKSAAEGTDAAALSGSVTILADWASAGSNIVKSLRAWKVTP